MDSKSNMRTLSIALLVLTGCGAQFDVSTYKKIDGVGYYIESPRDPECYAKLLNKAYRWNIDHGLFTCPMSLRGLSVFVRDGWSFKADYVVAKGTELWGQETMLGDSIEIAEHAFALSHELLHRYNSIERGINFVDEMAHKDWDKNGWEETTADFVSSLHVTDRCKINDSFRNHYQVNSP
jgi:hypothetical protein